MRLTDLHPKFVGAGGAGVTRNGQPVPERHGVGLLFDCPHGATCPSKQGVEYPEEAGRQFVHFANPFDGGPAYGEPTWSRTGETFETLTLAPSIHSVKGKGGCGWHGFIRNGHIIEA